MKLATVVHRDGHHVAVVDAERETVHLITHVGGQPVATMLEVIERGGSGQTTLKHGATLRLGEVKLAAPVLRPARNVICIGKNYHEHAREFARSGFDAGAPKTLDAIPAAPIVFTKFPESVIGTGAVVRCPEALGHALDYEAELA